MRVYDAIGLRDSPVLPQLLSDMSTQFLSVVHSSDTIISMYIHRNTPEKAIFIWQNTLSFFLNT